MENGFYILKIYDIQEASPYTMPFRDKTQALATIWELRDAFRNKEDGYAELICNLEDNFKVIYTAGIKA